MVTYTLNPDLTNLQGDWVRTGGSTVHGVLADVDDNTYMRGPNDRINQYMRVHAADVFTINSTTERIRRMRVRYRGVVATKQELRIRLFNFVSRKWTTVHLQGALGSSTRDLASKWWYADASGKEWTQTEMNRQCLEFWDNSLGTANLGPIVRKAWLEAETQQRVTVSTVDIETLSGGVLASTTQPRVTWVYAQAENFPEHRFEVAVFTSEQYGAQGFNPATSEATYRTKQFGPAEGHVVERNLRNGKTYRAYVRASQMFNGQEWWSDWANVQFTITLSPPGIPELSLAQEITNYRNRVMVRGHVNVLSEEDAAQVTTAGTWVGVGGLTGSPARVTSPAPPTGVAGAALQVTANGTSFLLFRTTETPGLFTTSIVPGEKYEFSFWGRGNTITGRYYPRIIWLTATGTEILVAGTSNFDAATGTWTRGSTELTAPAGAVGVAAYIQISTTANGNPANGTIFYVAGAQIAPKDTGDATPLPFIRGGLENATTYDVEYADAPYYGEIAAENIQHGGAAEGNTNGYFARANNVVTLTNELESRRSMIRWLTQTGTSATLDIGVSSVATPPELESYAFVPVVGQQYEIKVRLRKRDSVNSVDLTVRVRWLGGDGADLGNSVTSAMAVTTTMTEYSTGTVNPAAGTVVARVELTLAQPSAGGEVVYIEGVSFRRVGAAAAALAEMPLPVNNPLVWLDHREARSFLLGLHQENLVDDYEAPPNLTRLYRVRAVSVVAEQEVASDYSPWRQLPPLFLPTQANGRQKWVVKDPLGSGDVVQTLSIEESWIEAVKPVRVGRFSPRNSRYEIVVKNAPTSWVFTVTTTTLDETQFATLLAMFESTRTLLVVSPRQQYWVDVVGDLRMQRHLWDERDGVARRTGWSLVETGTPSADV